MDLGRLDLCLRCKEVVESERFYRKLGFEVVEGNPSDGWVIVANDSVRLGLFDAQFMDSDRFSLNFRNGNIPKLSVALVDAGIKLEGAPKLVGESGGSIRVRDPDGNLLFFDSQG